MSYRSDPPRQFLLVLSPHHFEKVEVLVERHILKGPEFGDDGRDAEHEELVAEVEAELGTLDPWPVAQDGIEEGHDRGLEPNVLLVTPRRLV